MNNHANTNLLIRSSLAVALAVAIWSPVQSQSAEPAEEKKMMERCQKMKEQKQKLMEDIEAQDAELTEHVAKMNSAPEDKKISLMAAVITHMVEQRIRMDVRKVKMDEDTMQHMMQHMQMGKESMSKCLLKRTKGLDEQPGSAHKEHQEELK